MKVLVDYDNLGLAIQRRGLIDLADRVLQRLSALHLNVVKHVDFRLYGGWDKDGRITPQAQKLSAELRASFPRAWKLPHSVRATMNLAQSMEAFPSKVLQNTFRTEPIRNIQFQNPTETVCRTDKCPLNALPLFFRERSCPQSGCAGTPQNLGTQNVQKLVDTMIVADMHHLAHMNEGCICLVGGDDDLWPGILGALSAGSSVVHLQPVYTGWSAARYLPQGITGYQGMAL